MTTTIKIELNGQSKTTVPAVSITSDELSGEELISRVDALYAQLEEKAMTYAMRRALNN